MDVSWSDIKGWDFEERNYLWTDIKSWEDTFYHYFKNQVAKLSSLYSVSSNMLEYLGGDPLETNWDRFRPLRLEKENDWSDWLAFLIETSNGSFNGRFFSSIEQSYIRQPKVDREVKAGGYRADLVIQWSPDSRSHIEVKTGDMNLNKTFGNCKQLELEFDGKWTHVILIMPYQIDAWQRVEDAYQSDFDFKIRTKTWADLAVALRRTLYAKDEAIDWLSWAKAFVGSIEQKLLGFVAFKEVNNLTVGTQINSAILMEQERQLAKCLRK